MKLSIIKKFSQKLNDLTHTASNMVNITNKSDSLRYARASCIMKINKDVLELIKNNIITKGDVLRTSEIAGILAAKKTSELIPLCHNINLNNVKIKIDFPELKDNSDRGELLIESYVESISKTGVEMEAMMAVSISALTVYDMCKGRDKDIEITSIKLLEKFGGKSGHYIRDAEKLI